MRTWFLMPPGDGILPYELEDQLRITFLTLFTAASRPAERAVFTRHEMKERLQCEVVAYFSPATAVIARQMGARV